jgi:hypothetical protein
MPQNITAFKVPDWMVPMLNDMVDLPGNRPEDLLKVLEGYNGKSGNLRATPEGQALAVEVQLELLMRLRVAGWLKER